MIGEALSSFGMALNFPNQSRSYDRRGRRVRFWGHDGAFEIFVEQEALGHINPNATRDEAGLLNVFDRNRGRILEVAGNVYCRHRRDAYTLLASDF